MIIDIFFGELVLKPIKCDSYSIAVFSQIFNSIEVVNDV